MTTITFKGRLKDIDGNILTNYKVSIWYIDHNPIIPERELGTTLTDFQGDFKFSYETDSNETFFNNDSDKIKVDILLSNEKIFESIFTGNFKSKIIDFGIIDVEGLNRGVKGRILDENGKSLENLVVVAEGEGKTEATIMESKALKFADKLSPVSLMNDNQLGKSKTDKNGYYNILYPPSHYNNILNEKPDIRVIVRDVLDVTELFRTEKYSDVSETIKKIDNILINRNWAEGWFITLDGTEKSRFTTDNQLEILIDNKNELESIVQSINNSKSYVYLTQFEIDPDFIATYKFDNNDELVPKDILVEVIRKASERGVDVKIILNENLAVPDTYNKINDYFKSTKVEVRKFKASGLHVMHAKTLTVDGKEAFIIGSPFKQDYWDTSQHLINDPRREPELVRPIHDVSVKLKGGSVKHVEEFFIEIWNYISKDEYHGKDKMNPVKLDPNIKTIESGETTVQIARSVTPETLTKKGELGIFEGYRKAIAQATDFIYLENQYFTNSSILKALKNAMQANKELQVIVVMNENPDIPGYKEWQNQGIEKLGIKSVEDILEHPQIGFFTLWSAGMGEEQYEIQPIYVHTKMAVVDDIWATVGTANLDGSSLTHVNELKGFFDAKFQRNMEMNVIIPKMDYTPNSTVKKLRKALWKEHLGIDYIKQPKSGWLEIWQKTAHQNIKSLNKFKPYLNGQILPYSQEKNVESQLKDLKINTTGWNLLNSE